nr:unnamed protein product [Callosobruchus analis]
MENRSSYFAKLKSDYPDVAERYEKKIKIIGGLDPLFLDRSALSYSADNFPAVSNVDIISYLVFSTSYYTKQQMKAYKSLEAFKYFEAGFVSDCGVLNIGPAYALVLAKVKHSQRLGESALEVWAIFNNDGSVESAHCTCIAGAGEVCSHIGALLFAVEYIVEARNTVTCTDVRALWKVPNISVVKCEPLRNMTFTRVVSDPSSDTAKNVEPCTKEEMINCLRELKDSGETSVLMYVMEPFISEMEQPSELLENPYRRLHNVQYEILDWGQLLQLTEQYVKIEISQTECERIDYATRQQAASEEWYNQRTGRVTASKVKQVCSTSITKPSVSLIKQICYPVKMSYKTKEMYRGLKHEKDALDAYEKEAFPFHHNLKIEGTGLIIQPQLPQLGATPDAIVYCTCCGKGCVEVKCPYLLRDMTLQDYSNRKGSCLYMQEEQIFVNRKHPYYFQMQMQMALTETFYCDFVIWYPKGLFVERIHFNEDFWLCHSAKALEFHKKVIMPELLGCLYTRSTPSIPLWFQCQGPDDGRPMLQCCQETCVTKWYHLECVGLQNVLDNVWICNNCQTSIE